MVQKAKLKVASFFSIILGFLTSYFVSPPHSSNNNVESKATKISQYLDYLDVVRPAAAYKAAVYQKPPSTSVEVKKADGQTVTIQRYKFDPAAFDNWLNQKGISASELSREDLDATVTEFRLETILNELDRIEGKTK